MKRRHVQHMVREDGAAVRPRDGRWVAAGVVLVAAITYAVLSLLVRR